MIAIIPNPLKIVENKGCFLVRKSTKVQGAFPCAKSMFVSYFAKVGIVINDCSDNADIHFELDSRMEIEEYALTVTQERIVVKAASEQGAFYAVQSIRQACLVDTCISVEDVKVPCMTIEDKPRFGHRGFMFDEGRHFYGKDIVKQFLDMMALNKLNIFHWHLTEDQGWRVEIEKYPKLALEGCTREGTQLHFAGDPKYDANTYGKGLYYTKSDIREIVAYAKERHINVIPEIDMPGHFVAAISCYPELSCEGNPIKVSRDWGVLDTIGCVGGDKFMPFVRDILDEICEMFPYEYFHIGGDEVPKGKWKACPKCQAKIKMLGLKNENELQGWFNNQVLDYLKTKNKKMIGWNEILDATELSNDTIVQWWIGDSNKGGIAKWLERGNKIIMSNYHFLYMDHSYAMKSLKKTYSLDLNTAKLDSKYESLILGIEAPQWTEFVRSVEKLQFNCYPRIQALAEINWTSKKRKNFKNFEARLVSQNSIMDMLGINYATRSAYYCGGIKNVSRILNPRKQWTHGTSAEFLKYTSKSPVTK